MGAWGNKKDSSEAPKFLPAHIRNRAFLTERGWEIHPEGNDNPASTELLVALGGSPSGGVVNDAPVLGAYSKSKSTRGLSAGGTSGSSSGTATYDIVGISGFLITPVKFNVIDQENVNSDFHITYDASWPSGLTINAGVGLHQMVISGTPGDSHAPGTTTTVTITDGGTSGASVGVTWGETLDVVFTMDISAS